jgi:hypothetical protein
LRSRSVETSKKWKDAGRNDAQPRVAADSLALAAELDIVMRLMKRTVARNLLLYVGAFYLSVLLGMPFFFAFGAIAEGHVYSGQTGALLGALVWTVPVIVDDVISALLAGWLVESSSPRPWAYGFGLFLFLVHGMSHHWQVTPTTLDLLRAALADIIPALVAVPVFLFAARRFQPRTEAA